MFPGDEIPLTPVMLNASGINQQANQFTYQVTSGSNVVSLVNTNVVKATAAGYAEVKVTANTGSGNPVVIVPIQVIGVPDVPLPIVRVTVKPASANVEDVELFRGETQQFNATAYNSSNNAVNTTFQWSTLDANVATVDQTGKVTAVNPGETKVQAVAQGIIGTADVFVYPDTIVVVTPFYAMPSPGATLSFSAKVYNARTNTELNGVQLQWEMPQYPAPFKMLNIGTIQGSTTGSSVSVKINNNAMVGMASFVAATIPGHPDATGVGTIVINPGTGGDCGADNPAVNSIVINNGATVTLNLFSNPSVQLDVVALNSTGSPVSGVTFNYQSSNAAVVNVTSDGMLQALSSGTATVTVCVGSKSTTVAVSVQ